MPERKADRLLTPAEVAALFRVDPKTVSRWSTSGRIASLRTPGGHRRYRESEIRRVLEEEEAAAPRIAAVPDLPPSDDSGFEQAVRSSDLPEGDKKAAIEAWQSMSDDLLTRLGLGHGKPATKRRRRG